MMLSSVMFLSVKVYCYLCCLLFVLVLCGLAGFG